MATAKEKAKPKAKTTKKVKAVKASSVTLHGLSPYVEKKNEEYMNENQREHFKQILKAWRLELMEEVDRTVTHMKDEAANFPDHFFLYAIFFVIFDLETLFLFAWAISFEQVGVTGFIEALVFMIILLIALVYLWRIGALNILKRHLPEQR